MNLESQHDALEPSRSERKTTATATNVPTRRDTPNPAVAVSWYADVTLNRFAYVGPMAVRLLGFPASAWQEDGFWAMHLPADERETVQVHRKRHVAAGADFELNYHMISSDGTLVRIRELTTVTKLDNGSVVLRGRFLRNDSPPFTGATPASVVSFGSWLTHELSQPIGVVLANADAMRHMLRASPPRVEEALEALADVAQGARDAASFLAVIRRSIRSADVAVTESDRAQ
jgi:PAS domain-containing protein